MSPKLDMQIQMPRRAEERVDSSEEASGGGLVLA